MTEVRNDRGNRTRLSAILPAERIWRHASQSTALIAHIPFVLIAISSSSKA
jgi:hypothetical protein